MLALKLFSDVGLAKIGTGNVYSISYGSFIRDGEGFTIGYDDNYRYNDIKVVMVGFCAEAILSNCDFNSLRGLTLRSRKYKSFSYYLEKDKKW